MTDAAVVAVDALAGGHLLLSGGWRHTVKQLLNFALVIAMALAMYRSYALLSGSLDPIVVVLRCAPRPERS